METVGGKSNLLSLNLGRCLGHQPPVPVPHSLPLLSHAPVSFPIHSHALLLLSPLLPIHSHALLHIYPLPPHPFPCPAAHLPAAPPSTPMPLFHLSHQVARDEAAAGRQGTAWEGEELAKLRDQLTRARQRGADLEQEVAAERDALARMRSAERTVVDLTTGMSVEAKRQVSW